MTECWALRSWERIRGFCGRIVACGETGAEESEAYLHLSHLGIAMLGLGGPIEKETGAGGLGIPQSASEWCEQSTKVTSQSQMQHE